MLFRSLLAEGIEHAVADAAIKAQQPCAVGVAEAGEQQRRRPQRQHIEAVAGGVTRQIHQQIDAIAADALGQLFAGEFNRAAPTIGQVDQPLADRIEILHLAIQKQLKVAAVAPAQQRFDEAGGGVAVDIWREIANAQRPLGVGAGAVDRGRLRCAGLSRD